MPALLRNLFPVIAALTPYILVLLSFGLFLVTNDLTIALGDKTAHTASLHLPQLLYYIAFTAFFSFPLYLPLIPTFLRSALPLPPLSNAAKKMAVTAVACGVMAAAVQYNTVLHPYLLADNRHYAFYVFRRFLLRSPPWSLLAAVPAYFAAAWLQLLALSTSTPGVGVSWSILYIGATTITLVGAPLVEPRYFIVAWMLWRVHVGERRRLVLAAEMVWFVVVNAGTLYMFLERSFEWAHEAGVTQRFMW